MNYIDVLKSDDLKNEMLSTAMLELDAFQNKYSVLSELSPIFDVVRKLRETIDTTKQAAS